MIISKTFEIISSDGEVLENGFVFEDENHDFKDLLRELKNENWELLNDTNDIYSYSEQDYKTGNYERFGLHFSRDNKKRKLKYWEKAIKKAKTR